MTPNARERRALEYYSLDISPKDPAKIRHPSNVGWSSTTIDRLLDKGWITCGENGWHVLTDAGRAALGDGIQNGRPDNG